MRGFGFGGARRNDNYRLTPQNSVERLDDAVHTDDSGKDGFTVLAKADPNWSGQRPSVAGTEGLTFRGPDRSQEQ